MIWFKRLLPIVILALLFFGYRFVRDWRTQRHEAEDRRRALVTAQIWVASAHDRADPNKFLAWRDSVLKANNISKEEMVRYVESFQKDYPRATSFARLANRYVDSLTRREDSLRKAAIQAKKDSLRADSSHAR